MKNIWKILKDDWEHLKTSMARASLLWSKTPAEISDFREKSFADYIEKYFPYPYKVTKWQICNVNWDKSQSIDIILLNPSHPHLVYSWDKFEFLLADWVDLAIELKPDIKPKKLLHEWLKQISSLKKIKRTISPAKFAEEPIKSFSQEIPSFIYTFNAITDIEKLWENIFQYYSDNQIPLNEQFDYLIIHDRWVIINYKHTINSLHKLDGKPPLGMIYQETKEFTSPFFVWLCNDVYHSWDINSTPKKYLKYYISWFGSEIKKYSFIHLKWSRS